MHRTHRGAPLLGALCLLPASLLAFVCLTTPGVDGCCMVPRGYPGDVDQSMQEVLILHADGHEELVLRVRPFFREADEPPSHLAWLVTVPTKPTAYRTASSEVFGEARVLHARLQAFYDAQEPRDLNLLTTSASVDSAAARGSWGLDISEPVTVGPYTITEVRTLGGAAVEELNRYLETNGFGTEDPDHLAWFAENEFTFLCIRIDPPEGSVRLGQHLDLVPLQIGFESERPYYPGKYSANQGDFGLELTLVTPDPLLLRSVGEVRGRLNAYGRRSNLFTVKPLPAGFGEVVDEGFPGGRPRPERWYVNRVDSSGFNRKDAAGVPAILGWKDDVFWSLGGAADEPPDWYYGDGEQPLLHPHNTRKIWGVLFVLAIGAVGFWLLRRSRKPQTA